VPKLEWRELAAIFAGGLLGALARVLLLQAAPTVPGTWPWSTFAANSIGTLVGGHEIGRVLITKSAQASGGARGLVGS
jgi:CrcB protein